MNRRREPNPHEFRWQTWWVLGLLWVALSGVAWGLADAIRGLDGALMLWVVALATWLGWFLAILPLRGWQAGTLASGVGVSAVLLRVGQLGDEWLGLMGALVRFAGGTWTGRAGHMPSGEPVLRATSELATHLGILLSRLREWLLAVMVGETAFDPIASALVWSTFMWAASLWAAWAIRRRNQPLQAMLPVLVLWAIVNLYAGGGSAVTLIALGATLLLMAFAGHDARERGWEANNLGVPEGLTSGLALAAIPVSLALVTAAALLPSLSVHELVKFAQRLRGQPDTQERQLADSLGLIPNPIPASPLALVRVPGLPNRHLIGSGPELGEHIVMAVSLTNLPVDAPAPQYYWRALTYDRYIGRGWGTSSTLTREYAAGDPAVSEILPFQRVVQQRVRALGDLGGLAYAAGSLAVVDREYQVAWRSSQRDAFGATLAANAYQAESLVPVVSEAQLRASGSDYPDWVRERYLDLPREIPERVLALARDLTATAATPYDRAIALETYLRAFPYTLDVPEPPPNKDVVDYFLFDLRHGYCDYYATAMVVLARAAGLPARLVVGYFTGSSERSEGIVRYVVTEAEAHSWVEIYFPEYGWVEFEPTGGRPPLERLAEDDLAEVSRLPELEIAAKANVKWFELGQLGGRVLASIPLVLVAGWLAWLVADGWRLRRLSAQLGIAVLYRRLYAYGKRLRVGGHPGDTPYEFSASFAKRMGAYAAHKRWGSILVPAVREAQWLVDLHVRASYSPTPPDAAELVRAIRTWWRLSLRLWLTWIVALRFDRSVEVS